MAEVSQETVTAKETAAITQLLQMVGCFYFLLGTTFFPTTFFRDGPTTETVHNSLKSPQSFGREQRRLRSGTGCSQPLRSQRSCPCSAGAVAAAAELLLLAGQLLSRLASWSVKKMGRVISKLTNTCVSAIVTPNPKSKVNFNTCSFCS